MNYNNKQFDYYNEIRAKVSLVSLVHWLMDFLFMKL